MHASLSSFRVDVGQAGLRLLSVRDAVVLDAHPMLSMDRKTAAKALISGAEQASEGGQGV